MAAAASLLLALAPGVRPAAQKPTFSARVDAVRVDVLVTEGQRPVAGLRAEDFVVLDNGVPQRVDLVTAGQVPVDVVLALDTSASVAGERLGHLRDATAQVLAALVPGDRAALLTFNQVVSLLSPLTGQPGRLVDLLRETRSGGATAVIDATYAGLLLAESPSTRGLLLVFTDGVDTCSYLTRADVTDAARRADAVAYAVAAGLKGRAPLLKDVADETGGALIEIESTRNLAASFTRILEEFRQRYLLSYTARGIAPGGWHKLEVRVRGRRVDVKARRGYQAGG